MRMERPEVFYTYEWALAASRAFADTLRPLVLLAHGSDRLRGVAALATAGETCETVSFLASNTADYCDILSSPDQRAAVLRALFDELGRLGMRNLILANIPSESATLRELPAIAQSHGFHPHSRPAYECGVIAFGSDAERQELLKSVAGKDREKRALKKMSQLGPIRVVHLEADQIEAQLHLIAEAQVARFLATNRISPYVQPGRRRFLSELSRLLAPLGWLRVSQLEVGGEPIAWNFGFRFEGGWFWYLPTFRIEHEDFSPGSCLLRFLVEEGCADPSVKRLDLGLGDEAYKSRFANSALRTSHVELSANRVRHVAGVGRDWLVAKARKSPHVEQSLYVTRDRFAACASGFGKRDWRPRPDILLGGRRTASTPTMNCFCSKRLHRRRNHIEGKAGFGGLEASLRFCDSLCRRRADAAISDAMRPTPAPRWAAGLCFTETGWGTGTLHLVHGFGWLLLRRD